MTARFLKSAFLDQGIKAQAKQLKNQQNSTLLYFDLKSANLTSDIIEGATLRIYQIKNLNLKSDKKQQANIF